MNVEEGNILESFITNYKKDKEMLPKNIAEIKYYGLLKTPNQNQLLCYTIVKKYDTKLENITTWNNRKKVLISLLHALKILQNNGYTHTDLNHTNIGWNENYDCIFTDHDKNTLFYTIGCQEIEIDRMFGELRNTRCKCKNKDDKLISVASTYSSFDYKYNILKNSKSLLKSSYFIGGLCEIIFTFLDCPNIVKNIHNILFRENSII